MITGGLTSVGKVGLDNLVAEREGLCLPVGWGWGVTVRARSGSLPDQGWEKTPGK